jgi:hypothetical protein
VRVAFWFGREVEVRYVATLPAIGDYVSHGANLWRVSTFGEDAFGPFVACDPTRELRSQASMDSQARPEVEASVDDPTREH